ncbi:MAG TPA: cysteine--tRNA ligase, partial [Acidaminococcaceae bacterium]|nr:cysteine--tRNA ligase [Acidaminococcaceae bacterium]
YRSPLDFSDQRLKEAGAALQRLRTARENLDALGRVISCGPSEYSLTVRPKVAELREAFMDAMRDDFNTALAISHWFALAKEINIYKAKVDGGEERPDGKLLDMMEKTFDEFAFIIGVLEQHTAEGNGAAGLEDKLIEILIGLRQEARKAKNYAQADAIRDKLAAAGVVIEDTPQGPKWKRQ